MLSDIKISNSLYFTKTGWTSGNTGEELKKTKKTVKEKKLFFFFLNILKKFLILNSKFLQNNQLYFIQTFL